MIEIVIEHVESFWDECSKCWHHVWHVLLWKGSRRSRWRPKFCKMTRRGSGVGGSCWRVWQQLHRSHHHHPGRPWKEVLERRKQFKVLQEELEYFFTAEQQQSDRCQSWGRTRGENNSTDWTDRNNVALMGCLKKKTVLKNWENHKF